jgi:hypothetical protein
MVWAGPIQCPNCGSPIDAEASVCPYCFSSSPHTAPWQTFAVGQWWWAYIPIFAGLAVFIVAFASDELFGTLWIPRLLEVPSSFRK